MAYGQALDESAQGTFLSLEVVKAGHLVDEMLSSLYQSSLPFSSKSEYEELLSPFTVESEHLQVGLHTIGSILEHGLLW